MRYDMIVTSETIYSQEALPALIRVFQKCLQKPNGVMYVVGISSVHVIFQ